MKGTDDAIRSERVDAMNGLEEARKVINEADRAITQAWEKRMNAVKEVAAWKETHGIPVLDAAREGEVLRRNTGYLQDPSLAPQLSALYETIMAQSREFQKQMISTGAVAYAGVEGAFSHMVCEKLYPDNAKLNCPNFDEVFAAVREARADLGVIPLENTSSGLVGEVMDLLMKEDLYIVRVADQTIEQCLLGLPEASLKDIEWVYSKDQALNQSKAFLDALNVKTVPYPNTAMAAQFVARDQDPAKAAIAAKENAAIYGLKILASNIQTSKSNTTRFLVIARKPLRKRCSHCALLIAVNDDPGSLARAIEVISRRGLNMDTLQSRPLKDRPFEYFFYIQCKGKLNEEEEQELLDELRKTCTTIKWLGSYEIERDDEN